MAGKVVNKVINFLDVSAKIQKSSTRRKGTPVAKFTVATNDRFKDKAGNGKTVLNGTTSCLGAHSRDRR